MSRLCGQVINMICNIRDESPNNVSAALENVLEALRSSELYAPHLLQHAREDKVVNDLVEGLMTVSTHSRVTRPFKFSLVRWPFGGSNYYTIMQ